MKSRCFLVLLVVFLLLDMECLWAVSGQTLVLATSTNSSIPSLTTQEARKLFLGVPLEKDGEHPVPLLNISDPLIYEVFLQKIAFMSANTYENQTLSVVFRLGGKRPQSYDDLNSLINALQQNPGTVTFLWEDQIRGNQGIKPVNVLWQGSLK